MCTVSPIFYFTFIISISSATQHQQEHLATNIKTDYGASIVNVDAEKAAMPVRPCVTRNALRSRRISQSSGFHCEPRASVHHLNHEPDNFLFRPSVAAVMRCGGSCDESESEDMEQRCIPVFASIQKRNVTVDRMKLNRNQNGPDCELVDIEVEDHTVCFCAAHSGECDQSRDMNKQKCERMGYATYPDRFRYTWSANDCTCNLERFHFPFPSLK